MDYIKYNCPTLLVVTLTFQAIQDCMIESYLNKELVDLKNGFVKFPWLRECSNKILMVEAWKDKCLDWVIRESNGSIKMIGNRHLSNVSIIVI